MAAIQMPQPPLRQKLCRNYHEKRSKKKHRETVQYEHILNPKRQEEEEARNHLKMGRPKKNEQIERNRNPKL